MREEQKNGAKTARNIGLISVAIALVALVVGLVSPFSNPDQGATNQTLTYDRVAPLVKDYLQQNNLLDENGLVAVPNTSSDKPDTATIEQAVDQLISTGKFDYLKGAKGDTGSAGTRGETGATGTQGEQGIPGSAVEKGDKGDKGDTGATGAAGQDGADGQDGQDGTDGVDGQDGLITATDGAFAVSGGTLSLKPCAVGQVLMYGGSTWDCATVSASGVDNDTTNVSATLTLSGTSLQSSITDSAGNTVNTPLLDLNPTFTTDAEMSNSITTAITGLNLSQYAKSQDVTDAIDALNINNYAKSADVSSAIATATSSLVSQTDLSNAISAIDLSGYATSGQLTALTTRVSNLETTATNHEGRITANETDIATIESNYISSTDLTAALGNYYTKSQTYSQSEVDSKLSDLENDIDSAKQDKLPICSDGQVVKYNATDLAWECAADLNNVSGDGSNFATENWVNTYVAGQNFATTSSLNALDGKVDGVIADVDAIDTRVAALEGAGYVTTSALNTTLGAYLKTANLSTELISRLASGTGISLSNNNGTITITSTASTDVFEIINDHTTIITPDPNKIYIDVSTNPAEQWVYESNTWTMVGQVNQDLSGYSTTSQMNTAITNAIGANNSNYTTTNDLSTLLNNKADQTALDTTNTALATETTNRTAGDTALDGRLDTIEADYLTSSNLATYVTTGQISDMATMTWVNGEGFLKQVNLNGYATESWVSGQDYVTSSSLTTTLANYTTDTELAAATNDMATKSGVANGYVTKNTLNCGSSQVMVGTSTNGTVSCRAIQDITTGALTANNNLITANTLATVMANYYTKTELDTKLQNMATGANGPITFEIVTVMPSPANQNPNTVYLLKGSN